MLAIVSLAGGRKRDLIKKLYKALWPFKDLIKFCITQEMTRQTFLCFLPKLGIKNLEDGME